MADPPPGEVCSPLPQPPAILSYSLHLLSRLCGGGGEKLARNHLHQLESGNHRPLWSFTSCSAHPPMLQLGKQFSTVPLPRAPQHLPHLLVFPPLSSIIFSLSKFLSPLFSIPTVFLSLNFSFVCSTMPY